MKMETVMKKSAIAALCAMVLLGAPAFAHSRPPATEEPGMTKSEREFIAMDGATRREKYLDKAWRKRVYGEEAGARKVQKTGRAPADELPRIIRVPKVPNFRDMGGWPGLDGKRVKQGMVYRSGGLNDNAHIYYTPEETLAFYNEGVLEERFGEEGRKIKKLIERNNGQLKTDANAPYLHRALAKEEKDRLPGKSRLSPEGLAFLKDELKIKTDLDLRRPLEVWGMTESPIGPTVNWVNISSGCYSGMDKPVWKEAFAKDFRLFLDEKNYPFVVHCIGGADRTGTLCYILEALLGVSDDDLAKDWEFTCFTYESQDFGHKRYDGLLKVINAYPGATTREKVEAYVRDCGFTDADIAHLRELMLEDPAHKE